MASSSSSKVPISIQPSNSSLQSLTNLTANSNKALPHRPQSQVDSQQFESSSNNSNSTNQNPFESKLAREEENILLNDSGSDSNMSFGGLIRGGNQEKGKGRAGSDRSNYNYINPRTGRPRYEDSPNGSIHSFPPTGSSNSTFSQYSTTAQSLNAALTSPPPPSLPLPNTTKNQPTKRHSMHSSINSTTPSHPRPRLHSTASSMIGIPEHLIVFGTKPQGIIGKHKPREIIRVERDYSAGDVIQFWSGWVWELEGRVSPTEYQNTMNELNTILASAHDPYASCFDNSLAILTLYLSPMFLPTHYKREMNRFERLLNRVNRDLFNPSGLHLLSPQKVAFLFLEIEYY